jgi:hypothetical protein
MPILDLHNSELVSHPGFPNDTTVLHIEFGAGKNYFGKKFFPLCYLTEREESVFRIPHFTNFQDYEVRDCHYNDAQLDHIENPNIFPSDRFDKVIFCNPYGYGFRNVETTTFILNSLGRILRTGGSLLVLSHHTNGWGKYRNASRFFNASVPSLRYNYQLTDLEPMDENHLFRQDQRYYSCNLQNETTPDQVYSFIKL